MPSQIEWVFEKQPRMGGASSGSWHNPLVGSGLPREHILAREAIQNSCDAVLEGNVVEVLFRQRKVSGNEREGLIETLRIDSEPLRRRSVLGLQQGNTLERIATNASSEIELLYVEDFGTHGLGGGLREGDDDEDRFRRLCLWIGVESSSETINNRGGTFGYGKTVYAGASDIQTVVFYSVFPPSEQTEGKHARLFVCSFFFRHSFDGERFTGRAWFGIPNETNEEAWPAEDEYAHELAEALGFTRRQPEDTGTSVLIIGSSVSMERLKEGVENYWWPRVVDNDLAVVLRDSAGSEFAPSPREREDLRPFLRCYDLLTGRIPNPEPERDYRPQFNAMQGKQLGTLILTRGQERLQKVTETQEDEEGEEFESEEFVNSVALMRNQRMVVEYRAVSTDETLPINGVFFAHNDSASTFALSEPPAHNNWDPESTRLDSNGRRLVRSALNRIRNRAREFQNSLRPDIPVLPSGLRLLERELARYLDITEKGPTPPPHHTRDPFEIHVQQQRAYVNGSTILQGEAKVSLKSDSDLEALVCRVEFGTNIVVDDNRTNEEKIPITSLGCDLPVLESETGENAFAVVELQRGRFATFAVSTEGFEDELDLDFVLEVEAQRDLEQTR